MGSHSGLLASLRTQARAVVVLLAAAATIGESGWAATRARVATAPEPGTACAEWTTPTASLEFDDACTTVRFGAGGERSFEISVVAWGRQGEWTSATATELTYSNALIQVRRPSFTERFVRTDSGVRQDFVVEKAPDASTSDQPLEILLALGGGMRPEVLSGARDVVLRSDDERASVSYSGLRAWDATGRELRAEFALDSDRLSIRVDDRDARYPVTIDPLIVVEETVLTASDSSPGLNAFGKAVSISGETCAAGWARANGPFLASGAVYVYRRSGSAWSQEARLVAADAQEGSLFGEAVSIDGDQVAVGATGHDLPSLGSVGAAYVFERIQDEWVQVARLTASDAGAGDLFGSAIALQGDTLAVGARGVPISSNPLGSGAIYVFSRTNGVWSEQAKLRAATTDLGEQLSLDGDTVIGGTMSYSNLGTLPTNTGACVVFRRNAGVWSQEALLTPPPTNRDLLFGGSTCISGNTIVVGARGHHGHRGQAWIYQRTGTNWASFPPFSGSDTVASDNFGTSAAIAGQTVLVASPIKTVNGINQAGKIYMYRKVGAAWTEVTHVSAGNATNGLQLGSALAFDGVSIAAAARAFSTGGAVHVFRIGWPSFCFGDGTMPTPCPCAAPDIVPSPSGIPRSGCANSLNLDGARLTARGLASPDHVELEAFIGPNHTGFAVLVKGDGHVPSGVASGDGIRCVDGALIRFGGHDAGSNGDDIGFWSYPNTAQTASVSAITGQLPGQTASYQLLYRNAAPGFCSLDTVNWTGAVQIDW